MSTAPASVAAGHNMTAGQMLDMMNALQARPVVAEQRIVREAAPVRVERVEAAPTVIERVEAAPTVIERVKEVPVEVIKEVPVEVIKYVDREVRAG